MARVERLYDPVLSALTAVWVDTRSKATTIEALITAIGATETTLLVNTAETFVDNDAIPSTLSLVFTPAGSFSVPAGKNLDIQTTNIKAGNHQIFSGDGDFDFADGTVLKTSWFITFEAGLTYIGPTDKVTYKLTEDFTLVTTDEVTSNIILDATLGYIISDDAVNNASLTISGIFKAFPAQYVLDWGNGTGDLLIDKINNPEIFVKWFGATGDGVTDDTDAFLVAIACAELSSTSCKLIRVTPGDYKITSTLAMTGGTQIIGYTYHNGPNSWGVHQCKISFEPSSEDTLFEITKGTASTYGSKVAISNLLLEGNNNGGGTDSKYAIDIYQILGAKFENLEIWYFQTGMYIDQVSMNEYNSIGIYVCDVAGVEYSANLSVYDAWYKLHITRTPIGFICQNVVNTSFYSPTIEDVDDYGFQIYKQCYLLEVMNPMVEDVPKTNANGSMFRVGHEGTSPSNAPSLNVFGGRCLSVTATLGSYLDADETNGVGLHGTYAAIYTNGIKCTANTAGYSIYHAGCQWYGNDVIYNASNPDGKVYGPNPVTGSGGVGNPVNRGYITQMDKSVKAPTVYATQEVRTTDVTKSTDAAYDAWIDLFTFNNSYTQTWIVSIDYDYSTVQATGMYSISCGKANSIDAVEMSQAEDGSPAALEFQYDNAGATGTIQCRVVGLGSGTVTWRIRNFRLAYFSD